MKKYISLLIIGNNNVLIRKNKFWNSTWNFINREVRSNDNWEGAAYSYAIQNFSVSDVEVKRLGGRQFEGRTGDVVEFWINKLEYIPKLPKSLFYKYMWVNKENINGLKEEDCGADVLYYIKKYFELC